MEQIKPAEWLMGVGSHFLGQTKPEDARHAACAEILRELIRSAGSRAPAAKDDCEELIGLLSVETWTQAQFDRAAVIATLLGEEIGPERIEAAAKRLLPHFPEQEDSAAEEALHPKFIEAGEALQRIAETQGQNAIFAPEYADLFAQMMEYAPARMKAQARKFLPVATHVDEVGRHVYSLEQLCSHFGVSEEEALRHIEKQGLQDKLHHGPVFPVH